MTKWTEDRLYKSLVLTQLALLFLGLTLSDFLFIVSSARYFKVLVPLFLVFGAGYLYLIWALLMRRINKGLFRSVISGFILFALLLSVLTENPLVQLFSGGYRQAALFSIHSIILVFEILLVFLVLKDLFGSEPLQMEQRLWRTAAVYLLMAIAFGSMYDLMVISNPEVFGVILRPGFGSYAESMTVSLSGMLKMQARYREAQELVKKVVLIQAVWNELFIALLVGNILTKK